MQAGTISAGNGVNKANALAVGLWIDHRKAMIVTQTAQGEKTEVIESKASKQLRRTGDSPLKGSYDDLQVPPDDRRQRAYLEHLSRYYQEVMSSLRRAGSILILGPGMAKGELKVLLDQNHLGERVVGCETVGKLTDRQIMARVRKHFEK